MMGTDVSPVVEKSAGSKHLTIALTWDRSKQLSKMIITSRLKRKLVFTKKKQKLYSLVTTIHARSNQTRLRLSVLVHL
jgi:hypothetical protein